MALIWDIKDKSTLYTVDIGSSRGMPRKVAESKGQNRARIKTEIEGNGGKSETLLSHPVKSGRVQFFLNKPGQRD